MQQSEILEVWIFRELLGIWIYKLGVLRSLEDEPLDLFCSQLLLSLFVYVRILDFSD